MKTVTATFILEDDNVDDLTHYLSKTMQSAECNQVAFYQERDSTKEEIDDFMEQFPETNNDL